MLGDGEMIKVFQDPWVRGKEHFIVNNMSVSTSIETKICELFPLGEKK